MSAKNGRQRALDDIESRLSDAERARRLASVVIPDAGRRWTVEEVENRLLECARDGERIWSAPGPSRRVTFWIDAQLFRGVTDFERNAMAEGVRERKRAPARGRFVLDARAHTRIAEALEWPMRYLADHDDERMILKVWIWCKSSREPFSRWHRLACDHRSTANRRLARSFEIIMSGLVKDGARP